MTNCIICNKDLTDRKGLRMLDLCNTHRQVFYSLAKINMKILEHVLFGRSLPKDMTVNSIRRLGWTLILHK